MDQDQLLLSWDDFEKMIQATFKDLLGETEFTDVTLATEDDKQINAHKVILSSCSLFFRNILRKYPGKNPILYLKDIKYEALQKILVFMYVGRCEIEQSELSRFLSTAKSLKIKGLDGIEGLLEAKHSKIYSDFQETPRKREHTFHKNPGGGRFKCKPCGIGFAKSLDLGTHHDKEHTENERKENPILIEAEVVEDGKQTFRPSTNIETPASEDLLTQTKSKQNQQSTQVYQEMIKQTKYLGITKICYVCCAENQSTKRTVKHLITKHFTIEMASLESAYFVNKICLKCNFVAPKRRTKHIHMGLEHGEIYSLLKK